VEDRADLAGGHACPIAKIISTMEALKSKVETALSSIKWRTMKPELKMHEAKRRFVVAIAFIFAMLALVSDAWFFQNPQTTYLAPESIILGVPPLESTALIYIAEDRHFFADNGLNVTVRDYEPAIAGVDGLLNGAVDLAGASEYAVVVKAFKREDISIIVSGDEVQANYLVGRKDRGIENFSDLRGKKIGIPRGTNVEFYLSRFLNLHGIDPRDVTIVDVRPPQFVNATVNGDFDAIICWQPYVNEIEERLTNGTVIWPAQNSQLTYGVIVCRTNWATSHPELISRFLKSLDLAAKYTISHPAEAKAIVQKRLNFSDEYMADVWPENHFFLSLDQSLITAMEDEGRWMIANNMTNASSIPDFRDYVTKNGLEAIRPGSVNIIG
jgi:ABC-type nitrate/sulfonate/bicarbonate transport system substrate-binding protein